jgi:hypothetical protein
MSISHIPRHQLSNEEVLYHLLKKERDYYKSILSLTHLEHDKLTSNQLPGELHPVLKKKKLLILCIHDIENARLSLKQKWDQKTEKNDPAYSNIKKELQTIRELLKEIFQLDIINQKLLEQQRQLLQGRLDAEKPLISTHY